MYQQLKTCNDARYDVGSFFLVFYLLERQSGPLLRAFYYHVVAPRSNHVFGGSSRIQHPHVL